MLIAATHLLGRPGVRRVLYGPQLRLCAFVRHDEGGQRQQTHESETRCQGSLSKQVRIARE